ncbi:MAG: peroxidase [Calditrichaeota bacterium]|nr:MAG: peroxidase [Calditrichota bacterium]
MASDWRKANLSSADQALCAFAEKLTRSPSAVTETDVQTLRTHGFDDRAIHDAVQVIGYFNYINRVADGLGVELETFIRPWEQPPESK